MELFASLGRITVAETMIDEAFVRASDDDWRKRYLDDPHGQSWFTSMHVSSFPGDDPRACERRLAYGLMAFAHTAPMPQQAIAAGMVGSAIEDWVVKLLDLDGRLLSASHDATHQIGLENADHWLTGSPDLIVLPRGWNRPLVIEKKSAYLEKVEAMQALQMGCVPGHARQCQGYIDIGHHVSPLLWSSAVVCRDCWRLAEEGLEPVLEAMICPEHGIHDDSGCLIEIELKPIESGVVLYSARDHPERRCSWYFQHDEQRYQRGLAILRNVQQHFVDDTIPPHPFGGKQWSIDPCKFCDFKRNVCKPDYQANVTKLSESHGVEWSRGVYGGYDPLRIRAAVAARWKGQQGYGYKLPEGYKIGRNRVQKERAHA
jgi:hypothetical protein